ncbi:xanthine dehydrogenase family protein molybdopterin-binding subunit [Thalassospira marina]|uniref:Dehydrogenase n=1 Tax=Thalassospira marina TaxID=2048283 RepID=A0ABN5FGM4_9PROT|nr:molybdopterin cofactor-binding domain-containing protein [Thalassospira marina]AUG53877.1 dehydrogenase [Thalassospira marina]
MNHLLSRRGFLKGVGSSAAILCIGFTATGALAAKGDAAINSHEFNPFVKIDADGVVTIVLKHFEMGQGTTTGLTTLIAEELDANWDRIVTEFAPSDITRYAQTNSEFQGTAGSSSIRNSFMQYRQAGAMARQLLVKAAAREWMVDPRSITVENGMLYAQGKSGHFGDFVALASTLEPEGDISLKTPQDYRLIGKETLHRRDNIGKTNGTTPFAMDLHLPDMIVAVIRRAPKFGAKVARFSQGTATDITGFIDAKPLPDQSGIIVLAQNTWAAFQARDALDVSWDFTNAETRDSDQLVADHIALLDQPAEFDVTPDIDAGETSAKIAGSATQLQADFVFPFLAHAPLEAVNCTIAPSENGVVMYDGCQFPSVSHPAVAKALGLEHEQVRVETLYAGGSFGRRASGTSDYNVEAAHAFDAAGRNRPVKLMWSREDDITGGYYRPMVAHRVAIGTDDSGAITAWNHRIATKSLLKGSAFNRRMDRGIDRSSIGGVWGSLYQLPSFAIGLSDFHTAIPVAHWRSVCHSHTCYVMESMMDMLARDAGQDPIDYRLALIDAASPNGARMAGVIKRVRELANWQAGDERGFACHFAFQTCVAVIVDIAVDGTSVHVNRLYIAIDCGTAVNPDIIRAQLEGGAGFALGAAMRNEITLQDGVVEQQNFPDYEPFRNGEMPKIDIAIMRSDGPATGVGEAGVPATAPALANAIFAKTGTRILQLPMTRSGFDFV